MTKAEFLEKLRIELSSGVTPQVLQENLNYYGQYIDDEIRKGRTESEVLAELGDPWILAKTAKQTGRTVYAGPTEATAAQKKAAISMCGAWTAGGRDFC